MGAVSGANAAFDPEPSELRETGDSTENLPDSH